MKKIAKGRTKNDKKSGKKENLETGKKENLETGKKENLENIGNVDIHIFCGKCEKEINMRTDFIMNKCIYCSKILCEKCMIYECVNPSHRRITYCKDCWDIGKEYRHIIEELESKIQNVYVEWKNKCRCTL